MKYRCILLFLVFCMTMACKRINPDRPTSNREAVALPKAVSSINIPLEIPLSFLEDHLNNGLNEMLFSEKKLSISNGLFTDINVLRTGPIGISTKSSNVLLIKVPMRLNGNLILETKVFGQMISTAIPYDERLVPEISFSPEIGHDWDLTIKNLKIESWGRSLEYNLLGYDIDFDPIIRPRIERILDNQLGANGLSQISFKNLVNTTWQAYGSPFKIEAGNDIQAYVYTIPQKINLNQQLTADNKLKLNIGLEGQVITQVGERPNVRPQPLPKLSTNKNTVNQLAMTLPLAVTYSTLDRYLNRELADKPLKIDPETHLIPRKISTQSFGDRALVKMDFLLERTNKKDLTGELYLVGKPGFDEQNEAIVFDDIDFDINTKNILANVAGWLRQDQLLNLLKKHTVYPIGPYLAEARDELQRLNYLSTDFASFQVINPKLDIAGIYVTEGDIRIYVDASGQMDIDLKSNGRFLD